MKTSEILMLDCRERENRKQLRKCLLRISIVKNLDKEWNEINTDDLDKLVIKIMNKYPIIIGYVQPVMGDNTHYSIMIKHKKTHEWLQTVYAVTLFEGFAKSLIFMYSYIKNNLREGD